MHYKGPPITSPPSASTLPCNLIHTSSLQSLPLPLIRRGRRGRSDLLSSIFALRTPVSPVLCHRCSIRTPFGCLHLAAMFSKHLALQKTLVAVRHRCMSTSLYFLITTLVNGARASSIHLTSCVSLYFFFTLMRCQVPSNWALSSNFVHMLILPRLPLLYRLIVLTKA